MATAPDDSRAVAAVFDVLASVYGRAATVSPRPTRVEAVPPGGGDVLSIAAAQRRAEQVAAGLVLDRLPFALVAVEADGEVVYANHAGRVILSAGDRLRLESGHLHSARAEDGETLQATIAALANDTAPSPLAASCQLVSTRDGRRFGVLATRAPDAAPAIVVLLVADPSREQALRALLRSIFGLTRAEAELCLLMLQGLSLEEAAHERQIALSTARLAWQSVSFKAGGTPPALLLQVLKAALVLPLDGIERGSGR